jgi:hypothetical protein
MAGMTRRVNYADNIFYLNLIFKQVASALKLAVDAELARDKIMEDLRFLDRSSAAIFHSLAGNHLLIERVEHLNGLAKLNRHLVAALEDVLGGRVPAAAALDSDREALGRIRQARLAEQSAIREAIATHRMAAGDQEHMVSEEEFKFLLASEEESEEH